MGCVGFLPVLAIAALVIGGLIWRYCAAKKRREALAALAAELGLSFSADDPSGWRAGLPDRGFLSAVFAAGGSAGIPGRYGQFNALSLGDARKAGNVLYGRHRGRELTAFDYQYTTGSGKNRSTHRLSAAVVTLECSFPELLIRPEGFFDKLAAMVGFEDIDFESHEFSKRFYVKCADRKFAYAVITAPMMEYLLSVPGWSLELHGIDVLIWTGRTWKVEEFRSAIAALQGFLDRIPRLVWKELGADGSDPGQP